MLENNGMSSTPPILKSTREDEQKTVGYPIETSKSKEEFCTEVVTNLFTFIWDFNRYSDRNFGKWIDFIHFSNCTVCHKTLLKSILLDWINCECKVAALYWRKY